MPIKAEKENSKMTPNNHDQPCKTDCREELTKMINSCVSKGGVYKAISVLVVVIIALWGAGYAIHAKGDTKSDDQAKEVERKTDLNTTAIAGIQPTLAALVKGQDELNKKMDNLLPILLKEIKRQK